MTEAIIHLLEMIDIDHEHRKALLFPADPRSLGPELLLEISTVRKLRKTVLMSKNLHLASECPLLLFRSNAATKFLPHHPRQE